MITPSPDRFLSASVREQIEAYYARVNEQSRLENLIHQPSFLEDPARHPAFFSDHGVVHVRDVARRILHVLQIIKGVLIPRRGEQHMEAFLYGYGVTLAYLHDIGMSDLSPFGRAMHPEFAAQAVFNGSLEPTITAMWRENSGNIAGHVSKLFKAGVLKRNPEIIFRELLSMSVGHSKSKLPVRVLDDPAALRRQMQVILGHNLRHLYVQQLHLAGKPVPDGFSFDEESPEYLASVYSDFESEAFDWLTDGSAEAAQLVSDVTDTLRALRCADAFRQRGTVEKTSGGYEIYASRKTGECVIALRLGTDKLYLMELPDNPDGAGEANIASSEFDPECNLRISFHRGSFDNEAAQSRSAYSSAYVLQDLLRDTVDGFWRAVPIQSVKPSEDIQVLLESTDDDPRYTELVREQICELDPRVCGQVQIVPSLRNVSELERTRYLKARELDWDSKQRHSILEKINHAGQKLTNLEAEHGFKHVRLVDLDRGEKLIEAGAPSSFVYFPLGAGLRIIPLGGYQSFSVAAWMPLGSTGVVRGDIRNADVIAEQPVSLLMVPKEVYLQYWYEPYSPSELKKLLCEDKT